MTAGSAQLADQWSSISLNRINLSIYRSISVSLSINLLVANVAKHVWLDHWSAGGLISLSNVETQLDTANKHSFIHSFEREVVSQNKNKASEEGRIETAGK